MAHLSSVEFQPLRIAVLTVSDTRSLATDTSGQTLIEGLEAAGHQLHERALVIELAALLPEHADMETVLLVGSRATRAFRHGEAMRVFTPRGYGAA